jgi:hypothetical protein
MLVCEPAALNQDYPAGVGHRATGFKQLNGAGDSFTLFGSFVRLTD